MQYTRVYSRNKTVTQIDSVELIFSTVDFQLPMAPIKPHSGGAQCRFPEELHTVDAQWCAQLSFQLRCNVEVHGGGA